MKINGRKIWKVLRVIGEILLAVYGVVMTILYVEKNKDWWKEAKENVARWGALSSIHCDMVNPTISDSQFRHTVESDIIKCRKDIDAIDG